MEYIRVLLTLTFYFSLTCTATPLTTVTVTTESNALDHGRLVVCYLGTWAKYRPDQGSFLLDNFDPSLCTHLVYSFAGLNGTTNSIRSLDPYLDLEESYGLGYLKKATALKNSHPHLKVTLAVGGWNEGSTNYSMMASTKGTRRAFIESAVQFLRKYGFDGLDLDWEYPAKRGGKPEDKNNFVLLVQELREEFNKHGWLLTAALGAAPDTMTESYDIAELSKHLDLMHVMCYDYHGSWDKKTGANAPLKPSSGGEDDKLHLYHTVNEFIKRGANPRKMVLGVPLYGRTFILENKQLTGPGSPALDKGFSGSYTREDGFLGYNEICREQSESNWNYAWDEGSSTPYMFKEDKWVSYDNEKSLKAKIKFAYSLNLAGIMVWSVDTDDFVPECGSVKFPLLRSISSALSAVQKEEEERQRKAEEGGGATSLTVSQVIIGLVLILQRCLN